MMITMSLTDTTFPIFSLTDMGCAPSPLPAHHTPTRDLVLGSWVNTMRDAVMNKERWKRRRTPTQDPSTDLATMWNVRLSGPRCMYGSRTVDQLPRRAHRTG